MPGAGDYRRIGPLASGGMAEVELVVRREGTFERVYAMKRLRAHLVEEPQLRAMFLDEARFAGSVRHANVASVLDVGEDTHGPWLVMDYIEGVSLAELMQAEAAAGTRLPVGLALRIASQVAEGLHAAHEVCDAAGALLHLVHRDVSPQNVLLGHDGLVRVADFGIAKALGQSSRTSTGVLKGKLGYLSPEQLRFEEPDRRSDLFALGVVLFEMLAGKRLYQGSDGISGPRRILTEPPPDIADDRPEVSPAVVELLFELLAKDPAHRPATAREVARRLEAAASDLGVDEPPVSLADYLDARFAERRRARRAEIAALRAAGHTEAPPASVPQPVPVPVPAPVSASVSISASASVPVALPASVPASPAVPGFGPPLPTRRGALLGAALLIATAGAVLVAARATGNQPAAADGALPAAPAVPASMETASPPPAADAPSSSVAAPGAAAAAPPPPRASAAASAAPGAAIAPVSSRRPAARPAAAPSASARSFKRFE
jgi:eukaryotic-like serine/threonine-protein kinase